MFYLAALSGLVRLISFVSRLSGRGAGGSIAGKVILAFFPSVISRLAALYQGRIIFVAGTNGKSTTSKLIAHLLSVKYPVIYNKTGANLIQGIVTLLLSNAVLDKSKLPYAILEIDELHLASFGYRFRPAGIVFLNLFRDQMDRYGELDTIRSRWRDMLDKLPDTVVYLNADDPNINSLKNTNKTVLYGIAPGFEYKQVNLMAKDSILCPVCHANLNFIKTVYSHIGDFDCPSCGFNNREKDFGIVGYNGNILEIAKFNKATGEQVSDIIPLMLPFDGIHNGYNLLCALSVAVHEGIDLSAAVIQRVLDDFELPFGRMETLTLPHGGILRLYLIKNPVGASQSLQLISGMIRDEDKLIFAINNNTVDGIDVSWLWDISVPALTCPVWTTGRRGAAISCRLAHAGLEGKIEFTDNSIGSVFDKILAEKSDYYMIANYTSMIEIQNIMKEKSIKKGGYWNG